MSLALLVSSAAENVAVEKSRASRSIANASDLQVVVDAYSTLPDELPSLKRWYNTISVDPA
jgi:hypothetical protein